MSFNLLDLGPFPDPVIVKAILAILSHVDELEEGD
jgi:hypothetical protein